MWYVLVEFGIVKIIVWLVNFVIVCDWMVEVLIFLKEIMWNSLLKFFIFLLNRGLSVLGVLLCDVNLVLLVIRIVWMVLFVIYCEIIVWILYILLIMICLFVSVWLVFWSCFVK